MLKREFWKENTHFLLSSAFCLILPLVFVQASISENVRGITDTTIKVACIADQTGPFAYGAVMLGEAPKNYFRHINERGGIHGRKIIYLLEDDHYSIPVGIAAFKKVIFKDQVFALMGPYHSGTIKALFSKMEKFKIPNVFMAPQPSTVNPIRKYIFVTGEFYDDDVGVLLNYIVKDLKSKNPKIAFCTFDGESGKEVLQSVKKWARLFGLKHPIHTEIISPSALEATSQVLSMKKTGITHVIIHHSAPGAGVLLREFRRFKLDIPVLGTLLSCTEDVIKLAKDASKNYIGAYGFSSWYDDTPGMKNLREITLKYQPGTDKPWRNKFYTGAWVATMVLCEGMVRAGKNLTPDSCVESIESIDNLDTQGICGPVSYSSTKHKGINSCKLFKTDLSSGKIVPFTDWRDPPKF